MTAYETARTLGRRAFYERATDTLRSVPENYCLAVKRAGRWEVYTDEHATKPHWDALRAMLETYRNGSTGDALADALGTVLPHA